MATNKGVALRKRQKIQKSNKTIFLWVAGASVLVGFCLVAAYFLLQQSIFLGKVIGEQSKTIDNLKASQESTKELKENIYALEANPHLQRVRRDEQKALQVVIDTLPADGSSAALGAAIQKNIIDPVNGITVESLVVEPVGLEVRDATDQGDGNAETELLQVPFRLSVTSGDINALRELMKRFERSIRVVDIDSNSIAISGDSYQLTLNAHAYYLPEKSITLGKKVVKP